MRKPRSSLLDRRGTMIDANPSELVSHRFIDKVTKTSNFIAAIDAKDKNPSARL